MIQAALPLVAFFAPAISTSVVVEDGLFPRATASIEIPDPGDSGEPIHMLDLLGSYADVTGLELQISAGARALLTDHPVPFEGAASIERERVQTTVEGLLRDAGCFVIPSGASGTRPAKVEAVQKEGGEANFIGQASYVESGDALSLASRHPAVYLTTVVSQLQVDVNLLPEAMRAALPGDIGTQVLPAPNSKSVVLVGFGDSVAKILRLIDALSDAAERDSATRRNVLHVVRFEPDMAEPIAALARATFHASDEMDRADPTRLSIVANERARSVLVRGPMERVERVVDLLVELKLE